MKIKVESSFCDLSIEQSTDESIQALVNLFRQVALDLSFHQDLVDEFIPDPYNDQVDEPIDEPVLTQNEVGYTDPLEFNAIRDVYDEYLNSQIKLVSNPVDETSWNFDQCK